MDKNDLRLNQAKRRAVTNAWKDTVWKRTPTEFDTKLYDAVTNFKPTLNTAISLKLSHFCLCTADETIPLGHVFFLWFGFLD